MIRLENISKEFQEGIGAKKVKALQGLSMEVKSGEIFGFLGPNGAGKSTAIKILMNFIFPDSGTATINGIAVDSTAARRDVGFLPENPYFYDHLTAEELLWFGGSVAGLGSRKIRERIALLLDTVNLREAGKRPLRTYSKGMVQRAGIALALVHDPRVVILDEPMSGLDPIGRKMIVDIILDLKRAGKTVFFSSHILSDIERLCDSVAILVGGRMRAMGGLDRIVPSGVTLEETFLRIVDESSRQEVA